MLQSTALRSMSNPNSCSQPDTYGGGAYWTGPNAGVHTNSGIMNHWFYMLSVGKSGTNGIGNAYNVTGIGISKTEKIAYRAETVYMTANTNFANARTYTIQAATDLYGSSSPEVASVTNAWYAVGVGNQSGGCVSDFSNRTVTTNTTITSCSTLTVQNVTVTNGAKLTIISGGDVTFSNFEVVPGAEFEVQ